MHNSSQGTGGEAIRESITPAYLRAGETVAYELALFHNDQARMKESRSILEASDAELQRQIANIFSGYSTKQLGRQMQRMLVEVVSQLRELFSSNEFREKFSENLPTAVLIACRDISWYIGYRLSQNLQYDPQRTHRLLEAVNHHKEIPAVVEQYRYGYSWGGDRTRAIRLGWQAVASKYFHFSSREEDIHEDEWQEKFIGVAQGLEDYTDKNPAIDALKGGFLGKLGAYLMRAAKNEETDYLRKQRTKGNIALNDALHAEDLRHLDREEDEETVYDILMEKGYSEVYGVREMERTVEDLISVPLAGEILDDRFRAGQTIVARAEEGKIIFENKEAPNDSSTLRG